MSEDYEWGLSMGNNSDFMENLSESLRMSPAWCRDPICPYCGEPAKLVKGDQIYSMNRGRRAYHDLSFFNCAPCGAYVGCHKSTGRPLGTLANEELRGMRSKVHAFFDIIWQSNHKTRTEAYKWLGAEMNLSAEECHIGNFDLKQCGEALDILNR